MKKEAWSQCTHVSIVSTTDSLRRFLCTYHITQPKSASVYAIIMSKMLAMYLVMHRSSKQDSWGICSQPCRMLSIEEVYVWVMSAHSCRAHTIREACQLCGISICLVRILKQLCSYLEVLSTQSSAYSVLHILHYIPLWHMVLNNYAVPPHSVFIHAWMMANGAYTVDQTWGMQ